MVCDEISDPHNLGAILRTAESAGAHGLIIPKRRSAGLTAIVGKTSAGAVAYLPVARVPNLPSLLKQLKKEGLWIFGAAADGPVSLYEADLKGPAAIVIGSEGAGMSRLVAETCDFLVSIPMKGKLNSSTPAPPPPSSSTRPCGAGGNPRPHRGSIPPPSHGGFDTMADDKFSLGDILWEYADYTPRRPRRQACGTPAAGDAPAPHGASGLPGDHLPQPVALAGSPKPAPQSPWRAVPPRPAQQPLPANAPLPANQPPAAPPKAPQAAPQPAPPAGQPPAHAPPPTSRPTRRPCRRPSPPPHRRPSLPVSLPRPHRPPEPVRPPTKPHRPPGAGSTPNQALPASGASPAPNQTPPAPGAGPTPNQAPPAPRGRPDAQPGPAGPRGRLDAQPGPAGPRGKLDAQPGPTGPRPCPGRPAWCPGATAPQPEPAPRAVRRGQPAPAPDQPVETGVPFRRRAGAHRLHPRPQGRPGRGRRPGGAAQAPSPASPPRGSPPPGAPAAPSGAPGLGPPACRRSPGPPCRPRRGRRRPAQEAFQPFRERKGKAPEPPPPTRLRPSWPQSTARACPP